MKPIFEPGENISIMQNNREDEIKSVIDVLGSRGVITAAVETLTVRSPFWLPIELLACASRADESKN